MPVRPLKVKSSYSIGFSPTGTKCFTLSRDVAIWDVASRTKTWRAHPFSHPSHAAFSPKGDIIAVKNTSGRIVTLTLDCGDFHRDFGNQGEGEGCNLLFSNCGEFIVDGSWDGLLTVRSATTAEIAFRREYLREMICEIHSVRGGSAWIIQHAHKATTNDRPPDHDSFTVHPWPFGGGEPSSLGIRLPFICASAASEDGSRLAVLFGAPPRDLHLYELPSEKLLWRDRVTIGGSGSRLRFSPSGNFLASVQKDRIVHYDALTGRRLEEYPLPFPSDVDYSPNTPWIALGSWQSGEIRAYATHDGEGEPAPESDGPSSRH